MSNICHQRWLLPTCLLVLLIALCPAWSAFDFGDGDPSNGGNTPPATGESANISLNGIALNMDYLSVLQIKGMPHFAGPAIGDIMDINNILSPPPLPTYTPAPTPVTLGGPLGTNPVIPPANPVNPFNPSGSPMEMPPVTPTKKIPKSEFDSIIWMFEGSGRDTPDKDAGWNTYVIFDRKTGTVQEVIVWVTDTTKIPAGAQQIQTPAQAAGNVRIGSGMSTVVTVMGYPNASVKIGANYLYAYPTQYVSYTVNGETRKVIGIAIGNKQYTVVPLSQPTDDTENAGATPTGGAVPTPGPGAMPGLNGKPAYKL